MARLSGNVTTRARLAESVVHIMSARISESESKARDPYSVLVKWK